VGKRYMGSGIKCLKRAGIRDHSHGMRDEGSGSLELGIRLTTKTGSGIKILIVFGTRDQHFG